MYLSIFSARLKEAMEFEGVSIRALSMKIGADRKSVRHWLQGKHFPRYDVFIKIAKYFDLSVDYLAGLEDNSLSEPYQYKKEMAIGEIQKNFLEKLLNYMEKSRITRYALAKKLQIDPKPITNWLTKGSMPEIGTLIKLAPIVNCTLGSLLGYG